MLKNLFACLILINVINTGFAQHSDKYFIRNYNRQDYQASISNFNITQDTNGIIYAANYNGVLIYSGSEWNLITLPGNPYVLSIGIDKANRIYLGLQNDFGYFQFDQKGDIQYVSLSHKLAKGKNISSISKIITTKKGVYFFSGQTIYFLDEKEEIHSINAEIGSFTFSLHKINDQPLAIQNQKGLVTLIKDSISVLLDHALLPKKSTITYVDSLSNDQFLISSYNAGLFILSSDGAREIKSKVSEYLTTHKTYVGIKLPLHDSLQYVFGTFEKGIIKTDSRLTKFTTINKASGLQSDIIKSVNIDHHYNLWAAMQEGISHIEINSPWMHWSEKDGLEGTPWDVLRHNGILYAATTNGLFYYEDGKFNKVTGLESKVWSLRSFKKDDLNTSILLAGSDNGLYQIDYDNATPTLSIPPISKIYSSHHHPNKAFIGSITGISELTYLNNNFVSKELTNHFRNTYSSILSDSKGDLWAASKSKGVYHLSEEGGTQLYDKAHGLPEVNDIRMIVRDNRLLFTTNHGIYKLNEQDQGAEVKFVMDSSLFSYPVNIGVIAKNKKDEFFASVVSENRKEHIEKLSPDGKGGYTHETIPFKRLPDMEIISIYPEDNGITWIAGSEGLFRYDENVKKDYTLPFNTVINKASVNDSVIFYGMYPKEIEGSEIPGISLIQPESYKPTLTYQNNNITFEYSATSYEMPEKNQYSYFLSNNDKGWSNWTLQTKKEYTNLSPGKYIFQVKSKNIYDTEGATTTYAFTVLPPWYMTTWAYIGFFFLAVFVVWLITIGYSVRVRTQRKKLRLVVADRTFEVMSQKKEIEKQHSLLKIQQEDILAKNHQLSESQEEVTIINQQLTELNTHLEKKVEKRTSKIKSTVKKLQQINHELDTFVYRASHDLKGPISRINGITTLAKLETPDATNLKYFNLIEKTAKDMGALLSKLAQVHEINNITIKMEEIDIPSFLSEVRDSVKFLDEGHRTKYTFDLDTTEFISDKHLLGIIIKNVIENALIFRRGTDKGHHIHISTTTTEDSFQINIRDNGIGIPSEYINDIFQMFFRGSDKSKGSGLGLYLVQSCIDKLRARIIAHSEEGSFTEFIIDLPLNPRSRIS